MQLFLSFKTSLAFQCKCVFCWDEVVRDIPALFLFINNNFENFEKILKVLALWTGELRKVDLCAGQQTEKTSWKTADVLTRTPQGQGLSFSLLLF